MRQLEQFSESGFLFVEDLLTAVAVRLKKAGCMVTPGGGKWYN
jgi:hypothetical protein